MEAFICTHVTSFDPELDKPVNVTTLMEERHIASAVQSILTGFKDYSTGFYHSVESSTTIYRSSHHLWISIGEVPLSKKLKEAILKKFQTDNGSLIFYNWAQMSAKYPEVPKFRHLEGKRLAFVGFPLPEEDTSEG